MPGFRLLLVLVVVWCVAPSRLAAPSRFDAEGQDPSVFDEAATAYRRGDYDRARALWTAVLDGELTDVDRARVCYDLGNVEWRSERRHQAIGWYTACLRLDPRRADAWANLEFARSEAGLDPADRGDLRSTMRRLLTAWRPDERRLFVLGGALLLAICLGIELVRGGRLWLLATLGAAGILVVVSLPWLHGLVTAGADPMLVIRSTSVSLRSEPHLDRPSTAAVDPGTVVQRIDELPDWVRVETPGGEKGWLQAESVFALER